MVPCAWAVSMPNRASTEVRIIDLRDACSIGKQLNIIMGGKISKLPCSSLAIRT